MKNNKIPPQGIPENKMSDEAILSLVTEDNIQAIEICKQWFSEKIYGSAITVNYYLQQLDYWGIYGEDICNFYNLCGKNNCTMTILIFSINSGIVMAEPGSKRSEIIEKIQNAVKNNGRGISFQLGKGFTISDTAILDVEGIVNLYTERMYK